MAARISVLAGALSGGAESANAWLDEYFKQKHEEALRAQEFMNRATLELAQHPEMAAVLRQDPRFAPDKISAADTEAARRVAEAAKIRRETGVENPAALLNLTPHLNRTTTVNPETNQTEEHVGFITPSQTTSIPGTVGPTPAQREEIARSTARGTAEGELPSRQTLQRTEHGPTISNPMPTPGQPQTIESFNAGSNRLGAQASALQAGTAATAEKTREGEALGVLHGQPTLGAQTLALEKSKLALAEKVASIKNSLPPAYQKAFDAGVDNFVSKNHGGWIGNLTGWGIKDFKEISDYADGLFAELKIGRAHV